MVRLLLIAAAWIGVGVALWLTRPAVFRSGRGQVWIATLALPWLVVLSVSPLLHRLPPDALGGLAMQQNVVWAGVFLAFAIPALIALAYRRAWRFPAALGLWNLTGCFCLAAISIVLIDPGS